MAFLLAYQINKIILAIKLSYFGGQYTAKKIYLILLGIFHFRWLKHNSSNLFFLMNSKTNVDLKL